MSLGNTSTEDTEELSDINMTPLIDVMLVLLIIFIITMPVITHSVKIDLPQASNQPDTTKPDVITLSIDRTGQIFWDDHQTGDTEFRQKLKTASKKTPQPEIHIRGDKHVEYQYMAKVMADIQQAGLTKLGFITVPDI